MEFDDDEAFDQACIEAAESAERRAPGPSPASAQAASTAAQAPTSATTATGQLCDHGLPCVQRRVSKPGPNYQRAFWSCIKPQGQTCRWIGWVDSSVAGTLPQGGLALAQPLAAGSGIDPCYRCDGVMREKAFGSGNFYGCGNYPWCRVVRSTPRQTAILELVASKEDDIAAGTSVGDGDGAPFFLLTLRAMGLSEEERPAVAAELTAALGLEKNGLPAASSNDSNSNSGCIARLPLATGISRLPSLTAVAKHRGWHLRVPPPRALDWLRRAETSLPPSAPGPGVEAALWRIPTELRRTLLPFQREGVAFGLQRGGRCLIADEMGTGKTLQALAITACYVEDWPLLVVVPASMRLSWACEVERWFPLLAPADVHVVLGSADRLDKELAAARPRVTIISFHMLNRLKDTLGRWRWDTVVVDESHQLTTRRGSGECQQAQVCLALIRRAKHAVLLSGTPSLSKPFDLFSQVDAVQPGLLGKDKYEFAATYCEVSRVRKRAASGSGSSGSGGSCGQFVNSSGGAGGWGGGSGSGSEPRGVIVLGGAAYPEELHALLCASVMIRRLKADVVAQLPTLRRTIVRVRPDAGLLNAAKRSRAAAMAAGAGAGNAAGDATGDGGDIDVEAGSDEDGALSAAAAAAGGAKALAGCVAAISANFGTAGVAAANGSLSEPHEGGLLKAVPAAEWLLDKLLASEETGTKFVVYAHHTDVLDALQERLETSTRWPPHWTALLRIDGSTAATDRHDRVARFSTEATRRVLLVSVTAGGQGLDLSAASVAVFVELPPRVFWLRQAEDRLHRRGQRRAVNVYYLVLPPGSHDDQRWLSMAQCLDNVSAVVNSNIRQEHINVNTIAAAGDLDDYILTTQQRPERLPLCSLLGAPERSRGSRGCSAGVEGIAVADSYAASSGTGPWAGRASSLASPNAATAERERGTMRRSAVRRSGPALTPSPATGKYKQYGGDGGSGSFCPRGSPTSTMDAGNAYDHFGDVDGAAEATSRSLMAKGALLRATQSPSLQLLTQSPAAAAATARTRTTSSSNSRSSSSSSSSSAKESGTRKCLGFGYALPNSPDGTAAAAAAAMQPESACTAQQQQPGAGGGDDDVDGGSGIDRSWGGGDSGSASAAGGSGDNNAEEAMPDDLYFEVSRHTGRIHLHDSADGLGHLGASFDAEDFYRLLGSSSSSSYTANSTSYGGDDEAGRSEGCGGGGERGETAAVKGAASAATAAMAAAARVRAAGLLDSLPRRLRKEHGALALAAVFLQDYRSLKPRQRNILHGQPARPPLAAAVAAIETRRRSEASSSTASAAVAGAGSDGACSNAVGAGGSRRRYTPVGELFPSEEVIDGAEGLANGAGGPDNATLSGAAAGMTRRGRTREIVLFLWDGTARRYHQRLAGGSQATPLCLICPKPACDSGPGGSLAAQSLRDLMCSKECYERYGAKTSGRSLRAIVRRRDRGVCDVCGRDTAQLVEALKVMMRPEDREKRAMTSDPRWRQRPKLLARLVKQPVEGRAWEADHVIGVAEGGGECTADNVRTLCVPCHAENSARQAGERAAERRRTAGAKSAAKASSDDSSSQDDGDHGSCGDSVRAAELSPPLSLSVDDFEKLPPRHRKRQKATLPQRHSRSSSTEASPRGNADFQRLRLSQQHALDEASQRPRAGSSGGVSGSSGGCSSGGAVAGTSTAAPAAVGTATTAPAAASASAGPLQPGAQDASEASASDNEDAAAAAGQRPEAKAFFSYTRVNPAPPWRGVAVPAAVAAHKIESSRSRKRAQAAVEGSTSSSSGEDYAEY